MITKYSSSRQPETQSLYSYLMTCAKDKSIENERWEIAQFLYGNRYINAIGFILYDKDHIDINLYMNIADEISEFGLCSHRDGDLALMKNISLLRRIV